MTSRRALRATAIHEAGHYVVARALGRRSCALVVRRDGSGLVSRVEEGCQRGARWAMDSAIIRLAGPAAESFATRATVRGLYRRTGWDDAEMARAAVRAHALSERAVRTVAHDLVRLRWEEILAITDYTMRRCHLEDPAWWAAVILPCEIDPPIALVPPRAVVSHRIVRRRLARRLGSDVRVSFRLRGVASPYDLLVDDDDDGFHRRPIDDLPAYARSVGALAADERLAPDEADDDETYTAETAAWIEEMTWMLGGGRRANSPRLEPGPHQVR